MQIKNFKEIYPLWKDAEETLKEHMNNYRVVVDIKDGDVFINIVPAMDMSLIPQMYYEEFALRACAFSIWAYENIDIAKIEDKYLDSEIHPETGDLIKKEIELAMKEYEDKEHINLKELYAAVIGLTDLNNVFPMSFIRYFNNFTIETLLEYI